MKKAMDDLLRIYEEHTQINIKKEDIKKQLVFRKKSKSFRLNFIYALLLLMIISITIPFVIPKNEKTEPNTALALVDNTYVGNKTMTQFYLKNHFEYYLDKTIANIKIEESERLSLYVGIEDTRVYLVQVINVKDQYDISYYKKDKENLLKQTHYQYDHFAIDDFNFDLLIVVSKEGHEIASIDVHIDLLKYQKYREEY